jgi:hypothetical protein
MIASWCLDRERLAPACRVAAASPPLLSSSAIAGDEHPARLRQAFSGRHLKGFQRSLVWKIVAFAQRPWPRDDEAASIGTLNPDALGAVDEQPGGGRHARAYREICGIWAEANRLASAGNPLARQC